jgi:hypothetical protein
MAKRRLPKLGTGKRFAYGVRRLRGKVRNPAAVMASRGRKKYGAKRFAKMAATGRHRAALRRRRK